MPPHVILHHRRDGGKQEEKQNGSCVRAEFGLGIGEQEQRTDHRQNADDLTKQKHVELRITKAALDQSDGQNSERAGEVERRAVIIMTIENEVENGVFDIFARGEHLRHHGILRKLIRLEERDHHLVLRAGVVRKDEDREVQEADEYQYRKDAFLFQVHAGNDTSFEIFTCRDADRNPPHSLRLLFRTFMKHIKTIKQ